MPSIARPSSGCRARIDLEHVRSRTGLDRTQFAQRFGLPLDQLIDWEAAGRVPNRLVWTYLKLIEREPGIASRTAEAIRRELAPKPPVAR
jgi:DNA-binding transcriptional regulator YiaG